MDFKEKMMQAAEEKKMANVGGAAMSELQKQLQAHDEGVRLADQEKKRAELGLTPKKQFNLQDKLRALKKKDEEEDNKPVVDPYTVKIRKLNSEVTEEDLRALLSSFGEITRVKIPMDEERGTNKGIGFVTFKSQQSTSDAVKEGYVKYDFYELPVEPATQSKGRMDRMQNQGERGERGGFRGGRGGGDRQDRGERRDRAPEGDYLRRKMD